MFETYRVKPGDCLWDIAKSRFGYAQFWPSLYSFNNWAAAHHIQNAGFITDPALIYPSEKLLLPDLDMTLLRRVIEEPKLIAAVAQAQARADGRSGSHRATPDVRTAAQVARSMRHNPAAYLGFKPFWALEYDLDDLGTKSFTTPVFTATIKWSGKILMQPVHDGALVKLSNHGAVIAQEFKADTAFGELGSEVSMTWKPGDKQPGFACNLTRAGHGPIPKITVEVDQDGPTFKLSWKPLRGQFHGFEFVAVCAAEITIKPRQTGNPSDGSNVSTDAKFKSIPPSNRSSAIAVNKKMLSIPRYSSPVVAAAPHHFGSMGKPTGIAPLVGVGIGIGSVFAFIAANPEILLLAVVP